MNSAAVSYPMLKNPIEELRRELECSPLEDDAKAIVQKHLPPSCPIDNSERAVFDGPLYISSIAAEGFRGVGPRVCIDLEPGNGLTLIVGGNGTGKSSIAEAAERVLTGTTIKWEGSEADAKQNWQNVHHDGAVTVGLGLHQSDNPLPIELEHSWTEGEDFLKGKQIATFGGMTIHETAVEGLREDLKSFPPILPYAELEAVVSGKASYLFDAFVRIVGLGEVDEIRAAIASLLYEGGKLIDTASTAQKAAVAALQGVEDDGFPELVELINGSQVDQLAAKIHGLANSPSDARVAAILKLTSPDPVELSKTVEDLGSLVAQLLDDHESERHETLAKLLEHTILLFDDADSDHFTCPICEQTTIDQEWRTHAGMQLAQHQAATSSRSAIREQIAKQRQVVLTALAPLQVLEPSDHLPDVSELLARAHAAAEEVRATNNIPRIARLVTETVELFMKIRRDAESIQASDESRLRPAIDACRTWVAAAAEAREFGESKRDLESARDWVKAEIHRQREFRMDWLSSEAAEIWDTLSPGDSIEMEAMQLLGSKSKRKLDLNCQTEGQSAKARSILSVGQMHALALSIFIPRATHLDSPFGFLLIDDPIHALDGIKIDGLAQVLHEIAKKKQVVVCTHDRRLEAALETLGLPANILRLERGTGSQVNVAVEENEVLHRLEDAHSLASDSNIDGPVRLIAVAGCCRTALEGAAARHFRRTAVAGGLSIDQVEAELQKVDDKLWDRIQLAVYGAETKSRDTASQIEADYSKSIRELIGLLNSSGHEAPSNCQPGKLPRQTRHAISQLFPSVIS